MDKKINIFKILFAICGSMGIYIVAYLLVISLLAGIPGIKEMHTMYLNAVAMAIAAGAIVFTIRKEEIAFKIQTKPFLQVIAVVILAYASSAFFNFLLGMIPWHTIFEHDVTPDEAVFFGIPLWARMLCYEVVAPISEELLFRQVIYKRLRMISPIWIAVVISAGLFGLYHGNLLQGIYAFIMGIFLALVYEWTGSVLAPIIFHMVANHLSDIMYEAEILGNVVYSWPSAVVAIFLMAMSLYILLKNKNKCSKNTLHSV